MLAAETAFEALKKDDSSAAMLGEYQKQVESSWIKDELWKVRNLHQGFERGLCMPACSMPDCRQITGGRGLRNRYPANAGYEHMQKLAELACRWRQRSASAWPGQRRRQAYLRQADRSLSLRHQTRRRSALASDHSRHRCLQHAMRERIWQPLPEFLSRQCLRDGRRSPTSPTANASA